MNLASLRQLAAQIIIPREIDIMEASTFKDADQPLILTLLSQELKSHRFFNTLAGLGMDTPYYRPHLDEVILELLGLNDENETYDFYFAVMNEHAEKIGIEEETVKRQASEVYSKLIEYRGKVEK